MAFFLPGIFATSGTCTVSDFCDNRCNACTFNLSQIYTYNQSLLLPFSALIIDLSDNILSCYVRTRCSDTFCGTRLAFSSAAVRPLQSPGHITVLIRVSHRPSILQLAFSSTPDRLPWALDTRQASTTAYTNRRKEKASRGPLIAGPCVHAMNGVATKLHHHQRQCCCYHDYHQRPFYQHVINIPSLIFMI